MVDELGVGLAGDHLLGLLRDEILEVDGVTIESLRPVEGPCPTATPSCSTSPPSCSSRSPRTRCSTSWPAGCAGAWWPTSPPSSTPTRPGWRAAHGELPADDELRAMALWAVAPPSAPVGADDLATGADPSPGVAAAEMVRAGVVLVVGRVHRSSGPGSASGSPSWPSWPTTAGSELA